MALKVEVIERVFRLGTLEIADPNPSETPDRIREQYIPTYPELMNAKIEGPSYEGNKQVYTFKPSVGVKG